MAEICRRYADETGRLANEVMRLSAGLFDVATREVDVAAELTLPSRFSFRLEDQAAGLEIVASGLRRLAPGRLGTALARREAHRRAEEMVDRHAGRLRHDLAQRLDGDRRAMANQLREAISAAQFAVTAAIDSAAAAQAHGAEAVAEAHGRLRQREERLERLRDRLDLADACPGE